MKLCERYVFLLRVHPKQEIRKSLKSIYRKSFPLQISSGCLKPLCE